MSLTKVVNVIEHELVLLMKMHLMPQNHSELRSKVMKLQEFCFKILSFPWLAKLAEWKFHCHQFYTVSFIKRNFSRNVAIETFLDSFSIYNSAWWNLCTNNEAINASASNICANHNSSEYEIFFALKPWFIKLKLKFL